MGNWILKPASTQVWYFVLMRLGAQWVENHGFSTTSSGQNLVRLTSPIVRFLLTVGRYKE